MLQQTPPSAEGHQGRQWDKVGLDHRFQRIWEVDQRRSHVAATERGNCGGRAIENWAVEGDFDELENGAVPCVASSGPVFDQFQLDEDGQYRPKSKPKRLREGRRVDRIRRGRPDPRIHRGRLIQKWLKTPRKAQATTANRGPPDPQVRTGRFPDRCRYSPCLLEQGWEQEPQELAVCHGPRWHESPSKIPFHLCTWCRN